MFKIDLAEDIVNRMLSVIELLAPGASPKPALDKFFTQV